MCVMLKPLPVTCRVYSRFQSVLSFLHHVLLFINDDCSVLCCTIIPVKYNVMKTAFDCSLIVRTAKVLKTCCFVPSFWGL